MKKMVWGSCEADLCFLVMLMIGVACFNGHGFLIYNSTITVLKFCHLYLPEVQYMPDRSLHYTENTKSFSGRDINGDHCSGRSVVDHFYYLLIYNGIMEC